MHFGICGLFSGNPLERRLLQMALEGFSRRSVYHGGVPHGGIGGGSGRGRRVAHRRGPFLRGPETWMKGVVTGYLTNGNAFSYPYFLHTYMMMCCANTSPMELL
jgi:hypothetical protein